MFSPLDFLKISSMLFQACTNLGVNCSYFSSSFFSFSRLVLSFDSCTDSCRYTKGAWTECDPKTNTRSRTLTLKKGEGSCVQSRTIQKKCRNKAKAEKGKRNNFEL